MQDKREVTAHEAYLAERLAVEAEALADVYAGLERVGSERFARVSGTAYKALRMLNSVRDSMKEGGAE